MVISSYYVYMQRIGICPCRLLARPQHTFAGTLPSDSCYCWLMLSRWTRRTWKTLSYFLSFAANWWRVRVRCPIYSWNLTPNQCLSFSRIFDMDLLYLNFIENNELKICSLSEGKCWILWSFGYKDDVCGSGDSRVDFQVLVALLALCVSVREFQ